MQHVRPTALEFRAPNQPYRTDKKNVSQSRGRSRRWASSWPHSLSKRIFDLLIAWLALLLLSPVILAVALLVRLTSKGPIFFRQIRIGKNDGEFEIVKFRTMRERHTGPAVTRAGDARLTPVGGFLRRLKLDELPQLVNVIRGDMSLVGPRPKVPHHQTYTLSVRPGVTGAASLAFRDEERFLRCVPDQALDSCQVNILMPLKRELDEEYARRATFLSDVALLFRTVFGLRHKSHVESVSSLQTSLLSLSRALGPSVSPEWSHNQTPERLGHAAYKGNLP